MNSPLITTARRLRAIRRRFLTLALTLTIAFAIQSSPLMAAEKVENSTQTDIASVQTPVPLSKVDIHAADLSTQPNMRSTGVMLDAEGRIHVMCVDPATPELENHLHMRLQASHQTVSDK